MVANYVEGGLRQNRLDEVLNRDLVFKGSGMSLDEQMPEAHIESKEPDSVSTSLWWIAV